LPVALRLLLEVVDHLVKELLCQLGVELLGGDGAVCYCLVRIPYSLSKLLSCLVDLILLLLIHDFRTPFSKLRA